MIGNSAHAVTDAKDARSVLQLLCYFACDKLQIVSPMSEMSDTILNVVVDCDGTRTAPIRCEVLEESDIGESRSEHSARDVRDIDVVIMVKDIGDYESSPRTYMPVVDHGLERPGTPQKLSSSAASANFIFLFSNGTLVLLG